MHELSLALNARDIIEAAAVREGFARVREIHLVVGELSCVEPEALRWALAEALRGTCAETAEVKLRLEAGHGRCPACGHEAAMQVLYDICPACQQSALVAQAGTRMQLLDLRVE